MTAQVAQAEQTLNATEAVAQKKAKELKSLQSQTKEQRTIALTVEEIQSMGKKNPITGNISLTPQECDTLKSYAVNSIIAKADNGRLQERLASAQKSAAIWKRSISTAGISASKSPSILRMEASRWTSWWRTPSATMRAGTAAPRPF